MIDTKARAGVRQLASFALAVALGTCALSVPAALAQESQPQDSAAAAGAAAPAPAVSAASAAEDPVVNPLSDMDVQPSEGLEFSSNGDGTCTIVGIGTCEDTTLVIPATSPKGETVAAIGEGALSYLDESLEALVFSGVDITVEDSAFSGSEVEQVIIVNSTVKLKRDALAYIGTISDFVVIDSTLTVKQNALYGAGDDMDIAMSGSKVTVKEGGMSSCEAVTFTAYCCTLDMEKGSFQYNDSLESIQMSHTVLNAGNSAFYDAGHKATATFDSCILNLRENSFSSAELTDITINNSITKTDEGVFSYNDKLESLIVNGGSFSLGNSGLYMCEDLTTLQFGADENDVVIFLDYNSVYSCSKLSEITFGRGDVTLDDAAMAYNDELSTVTFAGGNLSKEDDIFGWSSDEVEVTFDGETMNAEEFELFRAPKVDPVVLVEPLAGVEAKAALGGGGMTAASAAAEAPAASAAAEEPAASAAAEKPAAPGAAEKPARSAAKDSSVG